jgi:hypothetical protein
VANPGEGRLQRLARVKSADEIQPTASGNFATSANDPGAVRGAEKRTSSRARARSPPGACPVANRPYKPRLRLSRRQIVWRPEIDTFAGGGMLPISEDEMEELVEIGDGA